MNYSQLRDILKLDGGSLSIATNTLTPNIAALLDNCNGGQPLVITNASAGPGDDVNETVVVKGQSTFLNVADLPVELRGTIDVDGNAHLFLKYTLRGETPAEGDWHFSSSFPTLPKVVDWNQTNDEMLTIPLDDLPLFNSYFVVVSQKQTEPDFQVELKPGINFVSRMRPTGSVGIIESTFGNAQPFILSGTIRLPKPSDVALALEPLQYAWDLESPGAGILLQADLGLETAVGPMKFDDLFFRIYSPITDDWLQKNDTYKPVLAYSGKLKIPSANLELDVVAPMEPGSTELLLLGNFSGVSFGKLEDLLDLAGTADLHSQLPDQIKQAATGLGKLELTHAGVSLSLQESEPGITWVSFTVGMPELKWKVWEDHFEIVSLACRFEMTDPFKSPSTNGNGGPPPGTSRFEATVSGTFQIEGVAADAQAGNRDGFTVYAELAAKQTIPLGQLMQTYVPGVPAPGDLTIESLRLSVASSKSYSMAVAMADDWKVPFGNSELTISEVHISIQHTQDGKTDINLQGNLNIAGLQVPMDASHTDGAWKFQGKTDDQQNISFIHLADEVFRPCGFNLPPDMPDTIFKNLSISYDSGSKDFSFAGESKARIPVNFGNNTRGVDVQFDLQSTFDPKANERKYSGFLRAEITLGKAPFKCEYDFGDATMIKANWDGKDGSLNFADLADAHGIEHTLQVPGGLPLDLTSAAFEYDLAKGRLVLSADSKYGEAFFIVSNANDKWDFVFGVLIKFSEIPGFPTWDGLSLKDSVLILSTVQDDNFVVPSLPEMPAASGQVAATGLRTFPTLGTSKLKLTPGVTVAALLELGNGGGDLITNLSSVVGKTELVIQADFDTSTDSAKFVAHLDGALTIAAGSEKLVLSDVFVQLNADPFGVEVWGTVLIGFDHVTLAASGGLVMTATEMGALFKVHAEADGKVVALPSPFGLRGVTLEEIAVNVGTTFPPATPEVTLGFEGKFVIGDVVPLTEADDFTVVLALEGEVPDPLYLSTHIHSLTIKDMITAYFGPEVTSDAPDILTKIKGEDLAVYWSEASGLALPDGTIAKQGFGFDGILTIGGFSAHAALTVSEAGVSGDAELPPMDWSGVFSLKGNGKGVTVKDVEKVPPGGATIALNSKHSPFIDVSATVKLFNLIGEEVEIEVADDGFTYKQKQNIGSLFRCEFDCVVNKTGFSAHAQFDLDIKGDLSLNIPGIGIDLGTISLDVSFDTTLDVAISEAGFTLGISGEFDFEGIHMTMPALTIKESFDSLEQLPGKIFQQIEDHAEDIFKEFLDVGKQALKAAEEEAKKIASAVVDEAKKVEHEAAEQAEKVAADAKAAYETAAHDVEVAEKKAAELEQDAEKAAKAAADEVENIAGTALADAEALGKDAENVAKDAAEQMGKIEQGVVQEVAQIGAVAEQAWKDAEKVADDIKDGAEKAATAIKNAAEDAGKAIVNGAQEAASAMEHEAEDIGNAIANTARDAANWIANAGRSVC